VSAAEEPIRTALIGAGNSGRHYHLPLLRADPRFEVRAVAAAHAATLDSLDLPDGTVRTTDWQAAVAADVDLVVVALPHDLHHPVAAAALEAGRHVLVEKPMTVTVAEADDLIARADRAGRVLAVHHQRRWEEDVTALAELVRSGEIGTPWHLTLARGHQGHYVTATPGAPHAGTEVVPWVLRRRSGGGVARLIGPHVIDHALLLAGGEVCSVAGRTHRADGEDVEDWIGLDLTTDSGVTVHAEIFRRTGLAPARAAVWGSEGMAVAPDGTRIEIRRHDGEDRVVSGLRPPGRLGAQIYDDVAAAVRHGRPLRVPPTHARRVVEIIELAELSAARDGEPVAVPAGGVARQPVPGSGGAVR